MNILFTYGMETAFFNFASKHDDKKKQEELLKTTIKNQDIVICTALIPGKKAPRIVTEEMVKSNSPQVIGIKFIDRSFILYCSKSLSS